MGWLIFNSTSRLNEIKKFIGQYLWLMFLFFANTITILQKQFECIAQLVAYDFQKKNTAKQWKKIVWLQSAKSIRGKQKLILNHHMNSIHFQFRFKISKFDGIKRWTKSNQSVFHSRGDEETFDKEYKLEFRMKSLEDLL